MIDGVLEREIEGNDGYPAKSYVHVVACRFLEKSRVDQRRKEKKLAILQLTRLLRSAPLASSECRVKIPGRLCRPLHHEQQSREK